MPARVAAIIPAYNEEATVGGVVRAAASSHLFESVVAVSDGSSDRTADEARRAGATAVLELKSNRGKGGAVLAGVSSTGTEIVCLLDADLKGLTGEHLRSLVEPVVSGRLDMNIGIIARGRLWNWLARRTPAISGQRCLKRETFDGLQPEAVSGYKLEVTLNEICRRRGLRVGRMMLDGLDFVRKTEKVGFLKGAWGYVRMLAQIGWALVSSRI
jgi:glycosyltransferase involved in cell wall biosynthesis